MARGAKLLPEAKTVREPVRVPHPIPYQGSKRSLAREILPQFPDAIDRLIEPFAGSAAVSLAAAHSKQVERFWINDAHQPLMALWTEIVERPDALAKNYQRLWEKQAGREREFFDEVRAEFNASHRPEHFLYLLARCVKGAVRYNGNGEFNNTPDNRRKGAKPDAMRDRIAHASFLLAGKVTMTSLDYRQVLEQCTPGDLIYMDPPYQGVSHKRDSRYSATVDHAEFHEALAELNRRGCRFIVSYDGRTGGKQHGQPLPRHLKLRHLELCAGRSAQATLLGGDDVTYESLYLSPTLARHVSR